MSAQSILIKFKTLLKFFYSWPGLYFSLLILAGYYMVMDTSRGSPGHKTTLKRTIKPGTYCLRFWYTMYGTGVDKLEVITSATGSNPRNIKTVWSQKGSKSLNWLSAMVTIKYTSTNFAVSLQQTRSIFLR